MNIYSSKQRWKWFLFVVVIAIFVVTFIYSNVVVKRIADEERHKITIWADAIQRKAALVNYTEEFFESIRAEERRRANLLAKAYNKLAKAGDHEDIGFYLDIISNNKTIPIILTDENRKINGAINVEFSTDTVKYLEGELLEEFSQYSPIAINYYGNKYSYLYYKESRIYTDLRDVLEDLIESFFNEVADNSASVPVIITDSTKTKIILSGNIKLDDNFSSHQTDSLIFDMSLYNNPIEIYISGVGTSYVFYKESKLLSQLRLFPYIQFAAIAVFLLVSYLLFSIARKSEQDQVWVGMSKETAHQLGTPLSSLLGWIEILKSQNVDQSVIQELKKDVDRLDIITQRFSKIGSDPELKDENLYEVIEGFVDYLRARTSKKVNIFVINLDDKEIIVPINKYLFEWVIENLCKNSIDAMSGEGNITIEMMSEKSKVFIDVSDTGKGITKKEYKTIFKPGYTTKLRGWGLGLTLVYRIVRKYHKGDIFVKTSQIGKGTSIRIILKKLKK